MAVIEITIPTIQYGNIKVTGTPEEFGVELSAAGSIGEMAAVYTNLAQQGFKAGSQRDVEYLGTGTTDPEPDAPQEATQGFSEEGSRRIQEDDDVHEKSLQQLRDELSVTVISEEENEESPTDQAGAPWNRTSQQAVTPKPWEKGASKAPAKVAKIEW